MEELDQFVDVIVFTLGKDRDRPIAKIAYPSVKPKLLRSSAGGVPKSHAMDSSADGG